MRVDHLVWFSPDLAAGEAFFARRLDRPPAYGGVHPGDATRNSLVSLGEETYIEILAPDPAQDSARLDAELKTLKRGGLYHWAAGGVDLEALIRRARRAGLEASEVVTGGRTRPDGSRLGWRLAGIRNHAFGALVPFFIDWTGSAHPAAGAPRGGRLGGFEVRTPEARALTALFAALGLDIEAREGKRAEIVATVAAESGSHELTSFDPLPRGFVI
jgi:hypothetical protein